VTGVVAGESGMPVAERKHELAFCDRMIATLVYLRLDVPQAVLGVLFGVDQATIARAVGEVRPLLAVDDPGFVGGR
jgi:hypothetical protein